MVAVCLSLLVLAALARPLLSWRGAMVLALGGAFAALFALPWLREQLALALLPQRVIWLCVVVAAVGFGLLLVSWPLVDRLTLRRSSCEAA